jgi:peroxiredoxin Q/BCP
MLEQNSQAPDFTLKDAQDNEITLSSFRGKKVVIYFYPKDNTPGCTQEACSFRDSYITFEEKDAIIFGISPDSTKSHTNFINKYKLPFYLLSDPEHKVAETYGAWGLKKMYGKEYMGIIRSTFVINKDGTIIKVFAKVKPKEHAAEVLEHI